MTAITPAGRGPQILAVYTFFTVLTTLAVWARVYCRVVVVRAFGYDDWLALLSWIFFVPFAAFAITGIYHGTGQHAWNIEPASQIPIGLKFWWLCEPLYVLSNMAIKASIAIMLLRIIVAPAQRITIWVVLVVTQLFSLGFFLVFIFQCRPSSYFWTRFTGGSGTCSDPVITVDAVYVYSAITCVGDFIYAILPCVLVWNMQMHVRQKVVVAGVLAMGGIASAATIARIPYIRNLANQTDFLYETSDVAIWSCSETGLGITAACCATLRPLFRTWLSPGSLQSGRPSQQLTPSRRNQPTDAAREDRMGPWVDIAGGRGAKGDNRPTDELEMEKKSWPRVQIARRDSSSSLLASSSLSAPAAQAQDFCSVE